MNTSNLWRLLKPFLANPATPLPIFDLVSSLIQIIDGNDEFEILSRIDSNVQKLIKVHMEAGRDHLKNALSADDPEDRNQWLNAAINSFIYAKGVEVSPEDIKAMICIAVCFSCMGYSKQSEMWYLDGYQKACMRHAELVIKLKNVSGKAGFWGWLNQPLFAKSLHDFYVEIFAVEKQILLLQQVISAPNLEPFPKEFSFPSKIQEIQKWNLLLNQSRTGTQVLLAFESKDYICKAINLNTGKLVSPDEIKSSFQRNGKHLAATWTLDV